jgi:cytosine/adenosine deaminase-related metal-dependent hydrolase
LLLRGALVLHLDPPGVEQVDVRIRDQKIEEVAPGLEPRDGEEVEDLAGLWLMPGLTVAHHHLYSALACGMPLPGSPPSDFADMLSKVWWRLDRALDAESIEISSLVGGVAALRAGVTTIIDHHASPNFIEGSLECIDGALGSLGLRRVLAYEVTDRGGPDKAQAGLRAHAGLLGADGQGMRAVLVGAHANFTLSDDTLSAAAAMARDAGVGIHIHVAEAVDDARLTGEPLIDRMDRLGALLPGSILAHCVHLNASELTRIGDAGAWVTHQPRSNQNNGVGYPQLASFPRTAALGTDGIGSDLFAEVQAGWFRAQEAGVGWSPDRWLGLLSSGNRLAGDLLGTRLGQIQCGAQADLVVLDPMPGPPLLSENLAAAFLFRLSSSAVRSVMIAGTWQLKKREPVWISAEALDERARVVAANLWKRMEVLP